MCKVFVNRQSAKTGNAVINYHVENQLLYTNLTTVFLVDRPEKYEKYVY